MWRYAEHNGMDMLLHYAAFVADNIIILSQFFMSFRVNPFYTFFGSSFFVDARRHTELF